MELDPEVIYLRKLEPLAVNNPLKGDHSETGRENISRRHAEQDGGKFGKSFGKERKKADRGERKERHPPVERGAKTGSSGASGHVADCDRIQRQPDRKDNRSGDKRRKQRAQPADEYSHNDRREAADDLRP